MRIGFALAALSLAIVPALAQAPASPLERLRGDLLGPASATQVLTQWCERLKLASPPLIHALRDKSRDLAPDAGVRALLQAGPDEVIRYRRVKLACGDDVLSEADNWYLPGRLTPEMNRQLDETDTSFGTVVRPLDFHRDTLEAAPVQDPVTIFRVKALLVSGAGQPFSLVIENYSRDLTDKPD